MACRFGVLASLSRFHILTDHFRYVPAVEIPSKQSLETGNPRCEAVLFRPFDEEPVRLLQGHLSTANETGDDIFRLENTQLFISLPPLCLRLPVLDSRNEIPDNRYRENSALSRTQSTASMQIGKKADFLEIDHLFMTEHARINCLLHGLPLLRSNHFLEDLVKKKNPMSGAPQQGGAPDLHEVQENRRVKD